MSKTSKKMIENIGITNKFFGSFTLVNPKLYKDLTWIESKNLWVTNH